MSYEKNGCDNDSSSPGTTAATIAVLDQYAAADLRLILAEFGAQRPYLGSFFVGIFSKCTIKRREVWPSSTNEKQVL